MSFMPSDIIFQSKVFLYYNNKHIESDYHSKNKTAALLSNKILVILLVLFSIGMILSLIFLKALETSSPQYANYEYIIVTVFAILSVIIDIPIAFITFLHSNREKTQTIISYYTFINVRIHFTLLKVILELLFKQDFHYFYFLFIVDYIIRSSLYFFGIVDFTPSCIINLILFTVILGLYYGISSINAIIFDYGISFIILEIGSIASSYCITYYRKMNHYYLIGLIEKQKEGMKIINSLKTGYIRITNGALHIMNHSLQSLIENAKKAKDLMPVGINKTSTNMSNSDFTASVDKDAILEFFFGNYCSKDRDRHRDKRPDAYTNSNGNDEYNSTLNMNRISKSKEIVNILQYHYNQMTINKEDPEFIFLTYETFDLLDGNQKTYEILFKFNREDIRFIFNDVTRTKQFEKKEFDLKIQNVFLTKVAHEFKNPLVCIDESLNQISELAQLSHMSDSTSTQIATKCSVIKSFTEYLLLLINDLDYFTLEMNDLTKMASNSVSASASASCINVIEEKINIKELVAYCLDMSNIKLRNSNKNKDVRIETNISEDLPRDIKSNYKKLKHILIKLLNNAIKYTNKGIITFSIDKRFIEDAHEDNENKEGNVADNKNRRSELIFIIQDTGIGIKDSLIKEFEVNEESFRNNYIGLFIIKHLVRQLTKGKDIQMISKAGIGTTFWFSIPIQTENDHGDNGEDDNDSINHVLFFNTETNYNTNINGNMNSNRNHYVNVNSNENLIYNDYCNNDKNSPISLRPNQTIKEKMNESLTTLRKKSIILTLPTCKTSIQQDVGLLDIIYRRELTILFVDDEDLARKALIRIIIDVAKKKKIKINVIESRDGSETLYHLFQHNYHPNGSNGTACLNKIQAVITDQKMLFINGSSTIHILMNHCNYYEMIPFFIVTAFDPNTEFFNGIKINGIYSKPLRHNDSKKILDDLIDCLK